MIENKENFQEKIPSQHLNILNRIKNRKILKLVRYSTRPLDEAVRVYQLPQNLLFRRGSGSLLMTLDSGLVIGFAYLSRTLSVSLWIEQTEEGERGNIIPNTQDNLELFPIDCCDLNYSESLMCKVIGHEVIGIKIVKRENISQSRLNRLPREAGLIFKLDSGFELIMSNGLDGYSGTFCIIYKHEVSLQFPETIEEILV